jgi:heme A synthase
MYLSLGVIFAVLAFMSWRRGGSTLLGLLAAFTAGVLMAGGLVGQMVSQAARTGADVVQQGANSAGSGGGAQQAGTAGRR